MDDPGLSDFIVPSIVRRGSVSIAISTAGKSPALARKLRSKLEGELDDEYAELALLIEGVRREVKSLKLKVSSKQWQEAIDLRSYARPDQAGTQPEGAGNFTRKVE